ncbi:CPBP family intramembrane metalloprotease [Candidatus Microgenomates bacterium]|nr:CPBP family intramembrane metalloprotease [Candidatus Microgenomates bacterium]
MAAQASVNLKSKIQNPRSKIFPWHWLPAITLGLLALIGVDIALSLLFGFSIGILQHFPVNLDRINRLIEGDSITVNFVFYTISRLLGLAIILAYVRRRGVSLRRFGFKSFNVIRAAGLILAASALLLVMTGIALAVVNSLLPGLNLEQEQDIVFTAAQTPLEVVLSFISLVIIAPLAEETIFRGFMLPALAARFGIVIATLVTSTLFGAIHWQINVAIVTGIMGILLAWLYYKTRSLWPAILFHSLKNLVAFILIFIAT